MNRLRIGLLFLLLSLVTVTTGAQSRAGDHWVGTWATAVTWRPVAAAAAPPVVAGPAAPRPLNFNNQTLRQVVHTSIGGDRVRIVFSNVFGTAPLTIGAASVALRDTESAIKTGGKPLLFGGQASVTIPSGASFVSDAVTLSVPALGDLAIDLFVPGNTETWPSPVTTHSGANQTSYVSAAGNHAGATPFPVATTTNGWFFLQRIDVTAPASSSAIVTFGDSITDGTRSSLNTNSRWPDELARRLQAQASTRGLGVLNAAIAGNRLLFEANPPFGVNALARFDRDVLALPGAAYVVVLEGINDVGMARPGGQPSAAELIAAHQQIIERAHARGLKAVGATLTPFEGAAYFTPEGETKRQVVNAWIRTSKVYDAVIDFDAVIRDPQSPTKFLPAYNSGDSLHPNDAGYKAMGAAIDLALFK
jgi:lysophospholipase L1-like esterase